MTTHDTFGGTEDLGDSLETVVRQGLLLNDKHIYLSDETLRKDEPIVKDAICYGWVGRDEFLFTQLLDQHLYRFDMVKGEAYKLQNRGLPFISPNSRFIALPSPISPDRYDLFDIREGFDGRKKILKDVGTEFSVSPNEKFLLYHRREDLSNYKFRTRALNPNEDVVQREIESERSRFLYWTDKERYAFVHLFVNKEIETASNIIYISDARTNDQLFFEDEEIELHDFIQEKVEKSRSDKLKLHDIIVSQSHDYSKVNFCMDNSAIAMDLETKREDYFSAYDLRDEFGSLQVNNYVGQIKPVLGNYSKQIWSSDSKLYLINYKIGDGTMRIRNYIVIKEFEGDVKGTITSNHIPKVFWRPK